jgi:hypothetical protein
MPEWMTLPELPDALDPKLAVLFVLIGVILSLAYFSREDEPSVKTDVRQIGRGSAANGGANRVAAGTTDRHS